MSRWAIAAGLLGLMAGWSGAQTAPADQNERTYKSGKGPSDTVAYDGQDAASSNGLPPPLVPKTEMPPEEDKTNVPMVYSFNPVQSQHEVMIGDEYFKKGNYVAALSRYDAATKWNDGNAVAWLRLGETQEKKSNAKAAREAYYKYLELAPDAKNAAEIKKRLAKLKG